MASSGVVWQPQWRPTTCRVCREDTDSTHGTMSLGRRLNNRRLPSFYRALNAKAYGHVMVRDNGWPAKKLKRENAVFPYDVANNPGR